MTTTARAWITSHGGQWRPHAEVMPDNHNAPEYGLRSVLQQAQQWLIRQEPPTAAQTDAYRRMINDWYQQQLGHEP